jgi:hypothetical protein
MARKFVAARALRALAIVPCDKDDPGAHVFERFRCHLPYPEVAPVMTVVLPSMLLSRLGSLAFFQLSSFENATTRSISRKADAHTA